MNTTAPIQKSTVTSILSRENLHLAIAFVLLLLWFHTALDKFADLWTFEVNLGRQPLPKWSVKPLTYAVPGTELLTGILLFVPKTRKYGFWVSAILMLGFTLYVGLGLTKILGHLPCACSKIISSLNWQAHFWLNIFLLLLSILGLYYYYPHKTIKSSTNHPYASDQPTVDRKLK